MRTLVLPDSHIFRTTCSISRCPLLVLRPTGTNVATTLLPTHTLERHTSSADRPRRAEVRHLNGGQGEQPTAECSDRFSRVAGVAQLPNKNTHARSSRGTSSRRRSRRAFRKLPAPPIRTRVSCGKSCRGDCAPPFVARPISGAVYLCLPADGDPTPAHAHSASSHCGTHCSGTCPEGGAKRRKKPYGRAARKNTEHDSGQGTDVGR